MKIVRDYEQTCKAVCNKMVLLDKTTLISLSCSREKGHYGPHARQLSQTKSTVCWPQLPNRATELHDFMITETYKNGGITYYTVISSHWQFPCHAWAVNACSNDMSWHCTSASQTFHYFNSPTNHNWENTTTVVQESYTYLTTAKKKKRTHVGCTGPGAESGPNGIPGSGSSEDGFYCKLEDGHTGCHAWWSRYGVITWPPVFTYCKLIALDEESNYRLYEGRLDGAPHIYYLTYYSTYNQETSWWYCVIPHDDVDNTHWQNHVWTIGEFNKKTGTKEKKKKKKKEAGKKTESSFPEDLIFVAARHRRVVGGRNYPIAVKWIARFSVTNQEERYMPIDSRLVKTVLFGPYKTEWGATRAAYKYVDRFSHKKRVVRLDYILPVLPPELREDDEGR